MQIPISKDEDLSIAMSEMTEMPVKFYLYPSKTIAFTVSATGEGWKSTFLGDFTFTDEEGEIHNGHPVYRHSEAWSYLYSLESGEWGLHNRLGHSEPWMRSTTEAPSPAMCQQWKTDDGKCYRGEITVVKPKSNSVIIPSPSPSPTASPRKEAKRSIWTLC